MEAVLFIGVQGSGKSTFYRERFFSSHVRINLDMLRTRHRERKFIETCLRTGQPFVIDNTNPTKAGWRQYTEACKAAAFRMIGYYFQSSVEECKRRNEQREGKRSYSGLTYLFQFTLGRLDLETMAEKLKAKPWGWAIFPAGDFFELRRSEAFRRHGEKTGDENKKKWHEAPCKAGLEGPDAGKSSGIPGYSEMKPGVL